MNPFTEGFQELVRKIRRASDRLRIERERRKLTGAEINLGMLGWTQAEFPPEVQEQIHAINAYELLWMRDCVADSFAVHTLFDGRTYPRVPMGEQLSNMACWPPWQKRIRRYRRSIRRPTYNPTHLQWKQVLEAGVPMLKVDLVRDNPVGIDTGRIYDWLGNHTDYPVEIIRSHLDRMSHAAAA